MSQLPRVPELRVAHVNKFSVTYRRARRNRCSEVGDQVRDEASVHYQIHSVGQRVPEHNLHHIAHLQKCGAIKVADVQTLERYIPMQALEQ